MEHIQSFKNFTGYAKEQEEAKKVEEQSKLRQEFLEFFRQKMDEWNISSPAELSDTDKKEFFAQIEAEWKEGEGPAESPDKPNEEESLEEAE